MDRISAAIIEDNPADAHLLIVAFRSAFGIRGAISQFHTMEEGKAALKSQPFTLLFADLNLPDSDADETINFIKSVGKRIPVIIITGIENDELVGRALESGAQDYLVKGSITKELLKLTVRYATERQKLVTRLHVLNQELSVAHSTIHKLEYLLPVCSYCKKIRETSDPSQPGREPPWVHLEAYIANHTSSLVTHGICPDCLQKARHDMEAAKHRPEKLP